MYKIVVTGGAGFLGSHIADVLSEAGHDVTIYDLKPSEYQRADQKFVQGDLRDTSLLIDTLKGKDYVYHLAALADLNEARKRPLETVDINIKGTLNILEAALAGGVKKVLFGSTVYVYSTEGGFYRCSKQACENYIEEYSTCYGLKYTVLRYGSLYGPRSNMSNGVFRLLAAAMSSNRIVYNGKPTDKREYIHVKDAARLSCEAMQTRFDNKHLVITGIDKIAAAELFTMFAEMLNKEVSVEYNDDPLHKHYQITPYTFVPKMGEKFVANPFVDMGQGILEVMHQIFESEKKYEHNH